MLIFPTDFPERKCNKNLPEQTIKFIGREYYLNQIQNLFKNNQIIAILGYGGLGKTTLALEYSNRLIVKDPNSHIRWFHADSVDTFEIEYKRLSKLLDINVNDKDIDFIIQKTNMRLKEFTKNILFIFDNLECYSYIKNYIKGLPKHVKILITTRAQPNSIDVPKIELLEIEPFNLNEAVYYIKKNLDKNITDDNMNRILELAKSTNKQILPIKLEKIISYMNFYYIKGIEKSLEDIERAKYHHNQVEYTLFLDLKTENIEAFEILQYCSALNPDFISFDLLLELAYDDEENERILQDKISLLNKLSLVSIIKKNDKNGVKIHRLAC